MEDAQYCNLEVLDSSYVTNQKKKKKKKNELMWKGMYTFYNGTQM